MKSLVKSIIAVGLFLTALSSWACTGTSACNTRDLDDPQPKAIEVVDLR
jgi:hypothetical protein